MIVLGNGYKVVLSIAQRSILVMLAERGRRQEMDPTNFKRNALDGLEDLQKKGLMEIVDLVGRSTKLYLLTDLGTQVVDQIYASQKQSNQVSNFATKVEGKANQ